MSDTNVDTASSGDVQQSESSQTLEASTTTAPKLRVRPTSRKRRNQERRSKEGGSSPLPKEITLDLIVHKSSALTLDQLNMLIDQLGYVPYNLIEIGASSSDPEPVTQVAMLYPLNKNDLSGRYAKRSLPFPTMLWLCCPTLHTKICELEVDGWVQKLHKRLTESDESATYLARMDQAHRAYATERWSLLSEVDRNTIEENGWQDSLKHSGIAGMKEFTAVKCLHCHYAHHLARPEHGNIIGEWVHELLLLKEMGEQR